LGEDGIVSEASHMIFALKRRHLHQETDRWGNMRIYFRAGRGTRIRIREVPGTEDFDRRYYELIRRHMAGELKNGAAGCDKARHVPLAVRAVHGFGRVQMPRP
jgi:hypothetical protein